MGRPNSRGEERTRPFPLTWARGNGWLVGMIEMLKDPLVQAIVVLAIIVGGGALVIGFCLRTVSMAGHRLGMPALAERPIKSIIFWLGVLVIFAAVLRQFNVDIITPLTAVLGLIAIGFFAVWSVLSHITATFILVLTRAFTVDDHIEFMGDPVKGRVKSLNTIYTVLEDAEGGVIYIPNNLFFQKMFRRLPAKTDAPTK